MNIVLKRYKARGNMMYSPQLKRWEQVSRGPQPKLLAEKVAYYGQTERQRTTWSMRRLAKRLPRLKVNTLAQSAISDWRLGLEGLSF